MEGDHLHQKGREEMTGFLLCMRQTLRICRPAVDVAFALLGIYGMLLSASSSACAYASSVADESKCDMQKGPCTKNIAGLELTLEITPKPVKAMEELLFSVGIKGYLSEDMLVIDLAMPGMYMGGNKVILRKATDGRYVGKGIIPRCSSGRRLWSATVDVPRKGKAEYLFDIIY